MLTRARISQAGGAAEQLALRPRELAPLPGREPVEAERPVAGAVEPTDRVTDGLEHPLHLVLASLVHGQLDTPAPEPAGARGRRSPVVELDPAFELRERGGRWITLDLGDVDLVHLVARVREPVRELAVVREQERTGRVGVEPADGDDARGQVDETDDGRPTAGVARRRDDAGRLVEQHVGERLQLEWLAVELDAVARADEGVQAAGLAVDGDATGLDQLVGAAARGGTGAGEPGVEAHRRKFHARHARVADRAQDPRCRPCEGALAPWGREGSHGATRGAPQRQRTYVAPSK